MDHLLPYPRITSFMKETLLRQIGFQKIHNLSGNCYVLEYCSTISGSQ